MKTKAVLSASASLVPVCAVKRQAFQKTSASFHLSFFSENSSRCKGCQKGEHLVRVNGMP